MKLRAIEISKKLIPEWNDNKKLTVDEQMTIEFTRIPATSEIGNYKVFKFDSAGNFQIVYNDNLLVSTFVGKITKLQLGEEEIKTGVNLATATHPKLQSLFTEIRAHLFPEDEDLTAGE